MNKKKSREAEQNIPSTFKLVRFITEGLLMFLEIQRCFSTAIGKVFGFPKVLKLQ